MTFGNKVMRTLGMASVAYTLGTTLPRSTSTTMFTAFNGKIA